MEFILLPSSRTVVELLWRAQLSSGKSVMDWFDDYIWKEIMRFRVIKVGNNYRVERKIFFGWQYLETFATLESAKDLIQSHEDHYRAIENPEVVYERNIKDVEIY